MQCVLIPSTDNIDFSLNIKEYQGNFDGYKLIRVDEIYNKPCKTYLGQDATHKFFNDMITESEYCSKVIETEFNKPLVFTKNDHEELKNFTKCRICKSI